MSYRNKNRKLRKSLLIIIVVIILCVGAVVYKMLSNSAHTTTPVSNTLPTAQSSFNGNEVKQQPAKTPDHNVSVTDNKGSGTNAVPPSNKWTTSKDGSSIIVYSPGSNSKFSSGDTVYGVAKSDTITYELEDSVSGVIAQGTASVVDGKFSIGFTFSTAAASGKINIFNQDQQGIVSNNVTIPVSFK